VVLQTPWAVLLCKFKDDQSEPPVPNFRTICERFFTTPSGGYNAFQFFSDMSHGNVDLSGSQVLGWFTVDANVSDAHSPVQPPPPDWIPRYSQWDMMVFARQAAVNAGVDINRFFATILIMNIMTGSAQGTAAQGTAGAVWADWRRVDGRNPDGTLGARGTGGGNGTEVFGQEMGHAYGLNHSYREGSNAEYQDFWDIMSTYVSSAGRSPTYTAVDHDYCARGPGMNAWNMRDRGWLDESRVWRTDKYVSFDGSVQLRPLHRHDLAGYLAAQIHAFDGASSNYLFELRIKSGWDEGIPRSAVLVHQFENGHSVILRGTSGQYDLANGGAFERLPYTNVQVTSIDEANQTATLQIAYHPDKTKECNDLKYNIDALESQIQELVRQLQEERDPTRKAEIREALVQLRFQLAQLWQRYRALGCST
jgi:Gametolysin peptidase M11